MPRTEVRITKKSGTVDVRVRCLGATTHWKRRVAARDVPLADLRAKVVALLEALPIEESERLPV